MSFCLKKTEGEHMAERMKYDEVPPECNPQTLNSWQFLWNLVSKYFAV